MLGRLTIANHQVGRSLFSYRCTRNSTRTAKNTQAPAVDHGYPGDYAGECWSPAFRRSCCNRLKTELQRRRLELLWNRPGK
jgi:hypothetical protein